MDYTYSKDELLEMYYHLKRARVFTLKMFEEVKKGNIRASFHCCLGQESTGVGIVSALRKTDWLSCTHRLQTAHIMRYDMYEYLCEVFGKKDGMNKGAAFECHSSDFKNDARVLPLLGTLGGNVPTYTGFAFGLKLAGKDEIVVTVLGDGGCSEGSVYEAWNLSALFKVPVVHVIENNGWAISVPFERQSAVPDISEKAAAIGLPRQIVDGSDFLAVRKAMDVAVEKAKRFEPNVVEIKTLRWDASAIGQRNDYRNDKDKIEHYKKHKDPVKNYENYLLQKGHIDQAYIGDLTNELEANISELAEKAAACGRATFADVYRREYIYATPETGGDL